MNNPSDKTVVVDVGARYGMHPSWRAYSGPLRYIMFEPDHDESERLKKNLDADTYDVIEAALGAKKEIKTFHLLKHRGLSSFLIPDLNSECFKNLKPGQAEIEEKISIQLNKLDAIADKKSMKVDFIKVDTEGTEHDVLVGSENQLEQNIIGVRCSCNFQPCFHDQKLFSETHDFLLDKKFILLNLDYHGYGLPRLGLFRKPDPIEPENFRYGTLVWADAVWIKTHDILLNESGRNEFEQDIRMLKLTAFCLANNAPDVGIDELRLYRKAVKRDFLQEIKATSLYHKTRLSIAKFLGRWRTMPDENWEKCRDLFSEIYDMPLEGGSDYYPQIQMLESNSEQ